VECVERCLQSRCALGQVVTCRQSSKTLPIATALAVRAGRLSAAPPISAISAATACSTRPTKRTAGAAESSGAGSNGSMSITKIEKNTRAGKLDVAELVALATALEIPPLELLFGGPPGDIIDYLHAKPTSTLDAIVQFTGDLPRRHVGAISVQLEAINVAIGSLAGHGDVATKVGVVQHEEEAT
jgi:hypothetical protein